MFYSEDIDYMSCSIQFIYDAVISDSEGKLSLVIADEWFPLSRVFCEEFNLGKNPVEEPPVRFVKNFKTGFSFPRKLYPKGHLRFNLALNSLSVTVLPFLTCSLAIAMASLSSLCERIARVSMRPSNSSELMMIAFSTPFLVMANRSNFSSMSFIMADRLFFASAKGMVFVIFVLLSILVLTIIVVYLIGEIQGPMEGIGRGRLFIGALKLLLVRKDDVDRVKEIMQKFGYSIFIDTQNATQYVHSLKEMVDVDFLYAAKEASMKMIAEARGFEFTEGMTVKVAFP